MKTYHERTEGIQAKITAKKKRRTRTWVGAISCMCTALFIFGLVLFVPYTVGGAPDLTCFEGSEYYAVMQKIAPVVFSPERKTNNFTQWLGKSRKAEWDLGGMFSAGSADMGAAPPPSDGIPEGSAAPDSYVEVTDEQTAGVTEGDLFKRSQNYLFYLSCTASSSSFSDPIATKLVLRAYTVAGERSALCGELTIVPEEGVSFKGYEAEREMYLSPDLKTITILMPCYRTDTGSAYTAIVTVDTQNVGTMSAIGVQYLSGEYVSSRMMGGQLLIVNNFSVRREPDLSKEENFLPHFGPNGGFRPIPADKIVIPDEVRSARYTVLAAVDTLSGQLTDCEALLYFSDEVYVSKENVYVNGFPRTAEDEDGLEATYTDITRIAYEGGMFEVGPSAAVCGTVKDRYCMDEYDGYFRVAVNAPRMAVRSDPSDPDGAVKWMGPSASLFIMDAETMQTVSSIERFAPEGETVQSARFDGGKAYICTAEVITLTDPVFVFDLSDPAHISSKDTGTIAGYSIALKKFCGGTLLGIGYGENYFTGASLKVEVYEETEDAVASVAVYTLPAAFSENYKSYFIDAEHGLVGIGVQTAEGTAYLLLRFDGYELVRIAAPEISDYDGARAFYQDGLVYLVDPSGLQVIETK